MISRTTQLFITCLLLLAFTGPALQAKSVYVIADINASPTPIRAYDLIGNTMVYQATYNVPYSGWGAVGIAIDSDNEFLFITYEQSNAIQVVNAKTMTGAGLVYATGAGDLAGIVYDHGNSKLYVVDRNTNKLYSYSWDPTGPSLTPDAPPYTLTEVNAAHGLALDETNGKLYIGDLTTKVKIYNTSDWSYDGFIPVSQSVMGVAIDVPNGIVYTGNAYPTYGSTGVVCKYDLFTETEMTVNIRTLTGGVTSDNALGLAVNAETGLLYVTTGNQGSGGSDRVLIFDASLTLLNATGDIGNPTGIAVPGKNISYNPLNLTVSDGLDYRIGECVQRGGQITYSINYDNALNAYAVDNVTITATLDPLLTWVSGGAHSAGTVTWIIGTLAANDPGGTLALVVDVSTTAPLGSDIDQLFGIVGDQTGPSSVTEKTLVCPNQPPVAVCNNIQLYADGNCEGYVTPEVIGAGSYDPDGDPLSYTAIPAAPYPLGSTPVTLTVSDGMYEASCPATVTVLDNTPPVITFASAPIELWPPNHRYETVAIGQFVQSVSDNCDGELTVNDVHILRVESDEPEDAHGNGDGNTIADMVFGSTCSSVQLRRERCGTGNGRVYRIHVRLDDHYGNWVESFFDVVVKHDMEQPFATWDGADWGVDCGLMKSPTSPPLDGYTLAQNYPNPFTQGTSIQFALSETATINLAVYDIHGRLVRSLASGETAAGTYVVPFSSNTLSSGMYMCRLDVNGISRIRIMQHIK